MSSSPPGTPLSSAASSYFDSVAANRRRSITYPLGHSTRKKPRRWPLVLRFIKGAIHRKIVLPVLLHALFTVLVVCLHVYTDRNLGVPSPITPSLSIVVGLMLVFRNQTSYNRFWDGRNNFTTIVTSVRNLARSFLCCSFKRGEDLSQSEMMDIERTIRILIAIPYAVKNHLRSEWGAAWAPARNDAANKFSGAITPRLNPDYSHLLPLGLKGHEDEGLGLPLELTFFVESFIKRSHDRGWFHAPQASQLTVQLNMLTDAYGKMETIRTTPFPVAILIHQKQVLALFGCVLPFAMVDEIGWWAVPMVSLVMFTLYGIEGIGGQLEDPFGYDRNDIKMDDIVADARSEIGVMLSEWKSANRDQEMRREMFVEGIL